tara:strand:- start:239 stop:1705 length:1467 start_codon:yes stop_codon:yes gene_type:complete
MKQKLIETLNKQQELIRYATSYPLSVAKLWIPHCHRWEGVKTQRQKGCGQPMKRIATGLYFCETCNITEKRTSQQEAILGVDSEATLISGGNRAGKTEVGAQIAVATAGGKKEKWVRDWMIANNIPDELIGDRPTTVWCASLSYKDGLEYLRPKLDKYLPLATKRVRWNSQDRAVATLPNGGRIVSMSCDAGREAFQGGSVKLVWIDEEPNDEAIFNESLLRTVDQNGRVIVTATPLKGLSWLFDRFVDQIIEGFNVVKISGLDNPYISSVKMRKTVSHLSEASQKSRLYGEFSAQSGLVYNNFEKSSHVIDAFEIPSHWRRYIGIDFGSSHPFCALWVAESPSGYFQEDSVLVVYRELYWTNKTTIESGREINRLSKGEDITWIVADPESKDGRLTLARELGLRTIGAPKHLGVNEGINMVKEYISVNDKGKSRLLVFPHCKNLLREFRLYKWDNKSKNDKPKKTDDHAMDTIRYVIMQHMRYNAHQ